MNKYTQDEKFKTDYDLDKFIDETQNYIKGLKADLLKKIMTAQQNRKIKEPAFSNSDQNLSKGFQ